MDMAVPNNNNHILLQNLLSHNNMNSINHMNQSTATIIPIHSLQSIGNMNQLNAVTIPINNSHHINYNQLLQSIQQLNGQQNGNIIVHSVPIQSSSIPMMQPQTSCNAPQRIILSSLPSNMITAAAVPGNGQMQTILPTTLTLGNNNSVSPHVMSTIARAQREAQRQRKKTIPINNNNPFCMALENKTQSNATSLTTVHHTHNPAAMTMNQLLDAILANTGNETAAEEILSVSSNSNDTSTSMPLAEDVEQLNYGNQSKINHYLPPKAYKCPYCSKMFAQRKELMQHETVHTGAKPYRCHLCAKQFQNKAGLHNHTRNKHAVRK